MLPIRQSYASSNILAGLRLVSEGLKPLHLSPSTHIYQNWASACLPLPQHPVVECHVLETCESYGCMHSTFNLYTRNVYALGVAMTEPQQSNSRPPRQVGVREFRGNMTGFLRQAGHGASFLITLHGQVIAEIRPLQLRSDRAVNQAHFAAKSRSVQTSTRSQRIYSQPSKAMRGESSPRYSCPSLVAGR
jgi:antitoxin (DNA-binding transcriptional repressor) of toxin-antitoxin stability system